MALKEKEKKKWEEGLKGLGLMDQDDEVEDAVMGNRLEMMTWYKGNFIFTKERFVFRSGVAGISAFSIKYSDIRSISKCMVSGFIPMGIRVEAYNPEKDKVETYKCSVWKRNNWIDLLSRKSGVSGS